MTGILFLDWGIISVSLFNTIILLWLGLTVLLNADRRVLRAAIERAHRRRPDTPGRPYGIALASGGLLISGAFFLIHSALVGSGLRQVNPQLNGLWHLGWLPIIVSPLAWYGAMLWQAGFWASEDTKPRFRRPSLHLFGLSVAVLLALGLMTWLLIASPLPSFAQVTQLRLSDLLGTVVSTFALLYSLYNILCIALALAALRQPNIPGQPMTVTHDYAQPDTMPSSVIMRQDVARRRARPWLIAASLVLLCVSVLVASLLWLVVFAVAQRAPLQTVDDFTFTIAWFDLVIDGLIALAVLAIGQAIISYEIFTGKTLPRRGLVRQWRNAVILAAGFSLVIGWSVTAQLRPIYGLLLSTLVLTVFYALFGWRSYAERERYINQLRPFVASQGLYERLLNPELTPARAPESDANRTFNALSENVLGARCAYLIAQGAMSSLFGAPLLYPEKISLPKIELTGPLALATPTTLSFPIDPEQFAGAVWAVPLWSERGLIGIMLLGDKRDGGLYAEEEIEIARATGERLVDTKASAEMARRLIALQRQRLVEGQVMDRRARRSLHDEILPRLHAAMLNLNGAQPEAINLLAEVHREISDLLRGLAVESMSPATAPLIARRGLISALRETVESEFAPAFDNVTWEVEEKAERAAEKIAERALTAEVIYYATREAVRNAALHGRSDDAARPLHLTIRAAWRDGLEIIVQDDGAGLESGAPSAGGVGHGLALHSTLMAVVGGSLTIESVSGVYTRVVLALPQSAWQM